MTDSSEMEEAKNNILNILKMEGYKLNSGELFVAFKEAGGRMENFKRALEVLTSEAKIKSDSDGNIMTIDDYQREKSQLPEEEFNDEPEEINNEIINKDVEEPNEQENGEDDLDSILKLKEETDSWLIDKLKNNSSDEDLQKEINELKERVGKLEKVILKLTKAFE